jgi:enoyl-CoA hydratase
MPDQPTVTYDTDGPLAIGTIDRPALRNAVDPPRRACRWVPSLRLRATRRIAILTGAGGAFCAGFDLWEIAAGRRDRRGRAATRPWGRRGSSCRNR